MPRIAGKQARGRPGTDSPLETAEGTNPADTWILDF